MRVGTHLIGRDDTITDLRDRVADRGALVLVQGEAGVGKTAVVRAALAGLPHREGGALATLSWSPYLPLRRACGEDLPPDTWSGDPHYAAARIEEFVGDDILFADDLHWADSATLDALNALTGRLRLVLGVRQGDPATASVLERFADAMRMDLEPLTADEAVELVSRVRPELSPTEAASVVERSGGNPLLLEELSDAGGDAASLELALLARCRALTEEELEGLGLLATAGRPLPEHLVPALGGLLDSGLVRSSDGEVAIRHALIEQVMGRLISDERRLRCHRVLAEHLDDPGEVARHLLAAGDKAAAHATALRAVELATTPGQVWPHLVTAAESAPGSERDSLVFEAINAATHAGAPAAAARLLEQLSDDVTPATALVRATHAYETGEWDTYLGHVEAGLKVVDPGTPEEVALLLKRATGLKQMRRDPRAGLEVALVAVAKAEEAGLSVGAAAKSVADCMVLAGEPDWLPWYDRALASAAEEGNHHLEIVTAYNLVFGHMADADFARARSVAERMTRRCTELRMTQWANAFQGFIAQFAGSSGDHEHVLREVPVLLGRPQRPMERLELLATLASTLCDVGRIGEAVTTVEPLGGSPSHETLYRVVRIHAFWMGGEPERALAELAPALAAADSDDFILGDALGALAWAAWDAGQPPPDLPEPLVVPYLAGVPHELDGIAALRAGRHGEAAAHFDTAAQKHADHHYRSQVHCVWAAAEARRLAGDPGAEEALLAAQAQARDSGMVATLARCERSLRAMGVRRVSKAVPSSSLLSPRETEVVALVAEGLTDRQIAARLGVAHRTVQTQVASARTELGAESRAHLVALVTASADQDGR